jgi:hypothetical protein
MATREPGALVLDPKEKTADGKAIKWNKGYGRKKDTEPDFLVG